MTIVIFKISIPIVKTAVLKNRLIFGEKSSPKGSVCLRGGGLKSYLDKIHLNSTYRSKGLPLPQQFLAAMVMFIFSAKGDYEEEIIGGKNVTDDIS